MATAIPNGGGSTEAMDDLYRGHKVVAMPTSAFGGMNVRDVVTSKNTEDRTPSLHLRRSRSRSAGRSPASTPRDIVQDVYDRMGVNYIRGRPSVETLLADNKALGAVPKNSTEQPVPRGRSSTRRADAYESGASVADSESQNGPRRSLSRGRAGNAWPPSGPSVADTACEPVPAPRRPPQVSGRAVELQNADHFAKPGAPQRQSMPQPFSYSRLSYSDTRDDQNKSKESNMPDDERDGLSVVSAKSSKSVKERINAYGVSTKANTAGRSTVRHSYGNTFNKRVFPPKIDIYRAGSLADCEKDIADKSSATSNNIEAGRNRYSSSNSVSQRSNKSSVANVFLAALSTNKAGQSSSPRGISSRVPVVEIPNGELHVATDMVSVAASSVSGEDFNSSPRKKNKMCGTSLARTNAMSTNTIEKLVEERVQAQVAILNKKLEAEIDRIESRLEQEFKVRIDSLEKKNDKLVAVLSRTGMHAL